MSSKTAKEIERKYVVLRPLDEDLVKWGWTPHYLEQIYLKEDKTGVTRRIRKSRKGNQTVYTYTEKQRISAVTAIETERNLTPPEFDALQNEARQGSRPLVKTRWKKPFSGHVMELDIYPFWETTAVLEVELGDEEEAIDFPPEITVTHEVTGDYRYKNTNIAKWLFSQQGDYWKNEKND